MQVRTSPPVRDLMTRKLITLDETSNLTDALLISCLQDVRHIPVVKDNRLIGIVSDHDLNRSFPVSANGNGSSSWQIMVSTSIDELMTRDPLTVSPDTSVQSAARIMLREKISALPVVDQQQRLLGMISTEDILRAYIQFNKAA